MGQTVVDELELQGVAAELAQGTKGGQLAADVFDGLEVVVLFKGNCEGDVVFHLAEVLNRAGVGVMIDELPFVSHGLEGAETCGF